MKERGFTLIEMLVVLAIIGTLAGIGFPLTQSFLAKSREAACLNQLRSLGVALQGYLQENNQLMPRLAAGRTSKQDDSPALETVLLSYVESPEAFRCPADKEQFQKTGSSYLWNSTQNGLHLSNLSFFGIQNRPDKIPLITDKESWHPSEVNFLYADLSSSVKTRFATGN
jgi:prepilin-type N-terminal cleavage/methylation domain-containing protein